MSSVRLSLIALVAGCGGSSATAPGPAPVGNTAPSTEEALAAAPADGKSDGALWSCQIGDYDPLPCRLERTDGGWYLRKLMGSQRFKGTVTFVSGDAIDFAGSFFCPWADCTMPMSVRFARTDGGYTADFEGDSVRLAWDSNLASEWGGAGYGGLSGEE